MFEITIKQIRAAQDHDMAATADIIAATDEFVVRESRRRATTNNVLCEAKAEDFAQEGRIAVWAAVDTFKGSGVGEFVSHVQQKVREVMAEAQRASFGVPPEAVKLFKKALRAAGGDMTRAKALAADASFAAANRRLSLEHAFVVAKSLEGELSLSLIAATDIDGGGPFGHALPDPSVDVARQALQDLDVRLFANPARASLAADTLAGVVTMPKDADARRVLLVALESISAGFGTTGALDQIERIIKLPADRHTRRIILDSLGMLRASISVDEDTSVSGESLLRKSDDTKEADRAHRSDVTTRVRVALDEIPKTQAQVLSLTYGINGSAEYGLTSDESIAAELLIPEPKVVPIRAAGFVSFTAAYTGEAVPMIEGPTKTCTKCLQVKSLNDFYKAAKYADGHRNDCKACKTIKARKSTIARKAA